MQQPVMDPPGLVLPVLQCHLTLCQQYADKVQLLQVMVNEEVDPTLIIKRLKQEIRDLKDEIRYTDRRCCFISALHVASRDQLNLNHTGACALLHSVFWRVEQSIVSSTLP